MKSKYLEIERVLRVRSIKSESKSESIKHGSMINNFAQRHFGITSYYWNYRVEKISNFITYEEWMEKRFGKGHYMKQIRENALTALKLRIKHVQKIIDEYKTANIDYATIDYATIEETLNMYKARLIKITKEL